MGEGAALLTSNYSFTQSWQTEMMYYKKIVFKNL
uniref:Uncharacterized protein n=1 Tax=Anguilla anguilla TaxID=7936 RepID=A0A0E9UV75_ANGAN